MLNGDAEGMLEVNHWCGIDQIAMMSWHGPVCTDAEDGNEVVWRAMQRFGNKILGVAVMDPTHMKDSDIEGMTFVIDVKGSLVLSHMSV